MSRLSRLKQQSEQVNAREYMSQPIREEVSELKYRSSHEKQLVVLSLSIFFTNALTVNTSGSVQYEPHIKLLI